jgi:predicted small lipoprotein YifL
MRWRPHALAALLLAALAAALAAGCGGQGSGEAAPPSDDGAGEQLTVQPRASYDLAATGEAERFITGVVAPGNKSLVGGTVDMEFAFLGTEQASGTPQPGPTAQGRFLAVPRNAPERSLEQPTAVPPAEAVGVYETEVAFDQPGFWQVTVTAETADAGTMRGTGAFHVAEQHLVPQVGDQAPDVTNLTMSDVGQVPTAAIDSRAGGAGEAGGPGEAGETGETGETGEDDPAIPDPHLHRTTISAALERQQPFVVLFATPVWCKSRFCGPITESMADLAQQYDDRAAFIHVEVWRDYESRELNDAYDAWVNKADEGREPWLFAVSSDGVVEQRWDNVPDLDAVESWLQQLPAS